MLQFVYINMLQFVYINMAQNPMSDVWYILKTSFRYIGSREHIGSHFYVFIIIRNYHTISCLLLVEPNRAVFPSDRVHDEEL